VNSALEALAFIASIAFTVAVLVEQFKSDLRSSDELRRVDLEFVRGAQRRVRFPELNRTR